MEIILHDIMIAQKEAKRVDAKQIENINHHHTSMNKNHSSKQNRNTIAILQYNLNKNKITTESILNHPDSAKFAILTLQKQY